MMVDTTIYGYFHDGAAFHVTCTTARPDGDRDDVTAIYYLNDDDPHGMVCDACGGFIFEPVERHPAATCDYYCSTYCGETDSCDLHDLQEREPDDPDDAPLATSDIDPPTLAIWIDLQREWATRPESAR